MGLENLKHIFEESGTNTGTPQVFVKTNLVNFQTPKINVLSPTLPKSTQITNTFTQPPFKKTSTLDDGLGGSIYNSGMNDSQYGVGGQVIKGNITTLDDGLGRTIYNIGKDDSVHGKGGQTHTIHQHDVTLLDEFVTLPEVYGSYQSSFSLYGDNEINYDGFPSYVNLNDTLRDLSGLQYIRTPFQTAGNNSNGALFNVLPEPAGSIDFTAIANRRKTFFNSPFFLTGGTNLWPDAPLNIRDYPSSQYIRTPFQTAGNLWNPSPSDVGQLNIPENLWPDAPPNIRDNVGTYSPLTTRNTGEGPGEYFDSATNLGLRLGKDTTWSTLYTANHSKKPSNVQVDGLRTDNPFQPFNYPNPNIQSTFGMGENGTPEFTSGFSRGVEPYIISELPTVNSQGGRDVNSGNRLLPFDRAKTDLNRVGSYLGSDAGLASIVSSNLQLFIPRNVIRNPKSKTNHSDDSTAKLIRIPQRFNSGYNPIATLLGTGGRVLGQGMPNLTMKSGFNMIPDFPFAPNPLNKDNYGDADNKFTPHKLNNSFVNGTAGSNETGFKKFMSSVSNFLSTGVTSQTYIGDGDNMTIAPIIQGDKISSETGKTKAIITHDELGNKMDEEKAGATLNFDIEAESQGMPFYFKDLRDKSYIFFRAFLEGVAENVTPTWAEYNYLGRSEPVYVYERAIRDVNFTMKMYAQSQRELDEIYKKIRKLTSLCYPEYATDRLISRVGLDNKIKPKTRMKPPLCKFRMGEMYGAKDGNEMLGFIRALSYVVPEESTWETEKNRRVPKFITATIQFQVIHQEAPNIDTNFYGINYDTKTFEGG